MKKVMLVVSLGAILMLGACSSNEESENNVSSSTNTESTTVSEQQESINTSTGWTKSEDFEYDGAYVKTIKEQVVLDNEIMKITFTGDLTADEDDVEINYVLENKTDSSISCYLTNSEMDGAMVDIKHDGAEFNPHTKGKGVFFLERESLFEDDLDKLSTIKSEVVVQVGDDYLKENPVIEFSLK